MKALNWLKGEYSSGRRRPPAVCNACGQSKGPIDAHSEDYAEPFGDHIGRYGVCFRCHMMIHSRFKNPEAWETYKRDIRAGWIFIPIGRDYYTFLRQTIVGMGRGVMGRQALPKDRTFLDDLTATSVMDRS